MIVPKEIAPVDYYNKKFIFLLENFILSIDYEAETFELQTPENIAYNESFSIVKSTPEWFEDIEFGVVDWIKKAIDWNNHALKTDRQIIKTSIDVEGTVYHIEYNNKNQDLTVGIPAKTIITHQNCLLLDFPEIQHIDNGELISIITTHVFGYIQGLDIQFSDNRKFYTPVQFTPKKICTSQYNYMFDYKPQDDLILLAMPTRQIHTNMITIELGSPELAVMHHGKMIEAIRNVVKSIPISKDFSAI